MITQIEVSESVVRLPKIVTELESLFRNAHPSKEDKDRAIILALELQRHANVVAIWALNS